MRRAIALLLLIAALTPGTWWRVERAPPSGSREFSYTQVPLPPTAELAQHLGPFRLQGAWEMKSPHFFFGSYSALLALPGGKRMIAFSDRGFYLRFAPPDAAQRPIRVGPTLRDAKAFKAYPDAESATMDPATGTIWIGWESGNVISRHDPRLKTAKLTMPPNMADWGVNQGAEAMARLSDGRFVVLREGYDGPFDFSHHRALIFADDPAESTEAQEFTFVGPAGFKPVDMAQLPDGRVLILTRKLVWPMPPRFAGQILIADPAEIRAGRQWGGTILAHLSSSLPVDNFEAMAIVPRGDGKVTVWLLSDDNQAVSQRTLLWKLELDPALVQRN